VVVQFEYFLYSVIRHRYIQEVQKWIFYHPTLQVLRDSWQFTVFGAEKFTSSTTNMLLSFAFALSRADLAILFPYGSA
jgi:hypothetical protein